MKRKKEKNGRKAGFRSMAFVSILVIGMVFGFVAIYSNVLYTSTNLNSGIMDGTILDEIIDPLELLKPQEEYQKSYKVVWEGDLAALAAEGDPGAGATGFLSVYFHPHQADNMTSYMENSSSNLETNCTNADLGFANADDTEVDLKHSTEFDVLFRVRGNATNCKVGAVWFDSNIKIQWTCADLSVGADTELLVSTSDGRWTANNTDYTYLYLNYWDDNAGAGFTITQDQTIEITSIKLLAYY